MSTTSHSPKWSPTRQTLGRVYGEPAIFLDYAKGSRGKWRPPEGSEKDLARLACLAVEFFAQFPVWSKLRSGELLPQRLPLLVSAKAEFEDGLQVPGMLRSRVKIAADEKDKRLFVATGSIKRNEVEAGNIEVRGFVGSLALIKGKLTSAKSSSADKTPVLQPTNNADVVRGVCSLPSSYFDGHFLETGVLPGYLQLYKLIELAERTAVPRRLEADFLNIIRPADQIEYQVQAIDTDTIEGSLFAGGQLACKATIGW